MDVMDTMQGISRTTTEVKAVSELDGAVSYLETRLTELRSRVAELRQRVDPLLALASPSIRAEAIKDADVDQRSAHVRQLSDLARHASETTDIIEDVLARLEV